MEPKTCFVAYCEDRHIDPVVRVFTTLPTAIVWVNEWMEEHVAYPEELAEDEVGVFVYWLNYGEESDHAFIAEAKIDDS